MDEVIKNGSHASSCTPEIIGFICGETQRRVQYIFIILLPAEDALRVFIEKLKVSCITALPQAHFRPRLILNLQPQTGRVTPSVNGTIYREIALESIQFGWELLRIIQAIWEADLVEGPIQV